MYVGLCMYVSLLEFRHLRTLGYCFLGYRCGVSVMIAVLIEHDECAILRCPLLNAIKHINSTVIEIIEVVEISLNVFIL